jgi:hypothetical protein
MTPRQRYEAILEGRTPDVLPRILLLMQFAAEYIGSNYGAFASDHRLLVEANLRYAQDFGIDQINAIPPGNPPKASGSGHSSSTDFHHSAIRQHTLLSGLVRSGSESRPTCFGSMRCRKRPSYGPLDSTLPKCCAQSS